MTSSAARTQRTQAPFSAPSARAQLGDRATHPDEVSLIGTVRLALVIAGLLAIAVGMAAVVVRLSFAGAARHWLAFPFTGIPAELLVAAEIFLHNLRELAAVLGLLLIAQSRHWSSPTAGRIHLAVQRLGELLLMAAVMTNVIVVGESLGAYGGRMLLAALPHGPVELAGYSLVLALYIQGRRRALPTRLVLAVAGLSVSLLAVAAGLETFVNL